MLDVGGLVDLIDIVEKFLATAIVNTACEKDWGKFFPCFQQLLFVFLHVVFTYIHSKFVEFGEHEEEWHLDFSKPLNELQIVFLRRQSRVNQYK